MIFWYIQTNFNDLMRFFFAFFAAIKYQPRKCQGSLNVTMGQSHYHLFRNTFACMEKTVNSKRLSDTDSTKCKWNVQTFCTSIKHEYSNTIFSLFMSVSNLMQNGGNHFRRDSFSSVTLSSRFQRKHCFENQRAHTMTHTIFSLYVHKLSSFSNQLIRGQRKNNEIIMLDNVNC